MFTKKSVFRMFSILLVVMFLLTGVLPAWADSLAGPLPMSGDFLWAKGMGGPQEEQGNSIAVDSSGNIYTTGAFKGIANFGAISLTSTGDYDIFVSKMDSNGNFLWAKSMGGASGEDSSRGIAVDSGGNVYTTGHFHVLADFDPDLVNVSNLNSTGPYDMFISKLDNNGNFVWAKNIGGAGADSSVSIAVTNSNVYITGDYVNGGNGDDIFISKYDTNGNVVWAKITGGTGIDYGLGIAIDSNGNVYTTGAYTGTVDFDPGAATNNLTSLGLRDIFISKLNTDGGFVWAKSMGGTGDDFGYGIALEPTGSIVYITGDYYGSASFGGIPQNSAGGFDIFVANYNSSGNIVWAKSMGGPGTDFGMGIAVDSNGNVYTTGAFSNTAAFGTTSLTSAGAYDIFVNRLNSDGAYSWAKGMGGTLDDAGGGIAVNSTGIYTTGAFRNVADFDPGANTYNLTSAGGADIFVSKLEYYTGVYYAKPIASGIGNCQSWANACALQSALVTAASGDEIWVRQGTHKPIAGTDRTATFQLKSGVAVYGGFAGTETALSQRDLAVNLTILSGDLLGNDNSNIQFDEPTRADNSYHVVTGASGATLDGFTVTGGNANAKSGGGMYNQGCNPTLKNVTFSNNSAGAGGGMYNGLASSPTLINVTFSGNSADSGGGMANDGSSPMLTNATFSGNQAIGGGGMYNSASNPTLTNVTFNVNTANGGGGGMYNSASSPTLTNVTFSGNFTNADGGGGMLNLNNSNPQIRNTIFWGNTATTAGAQIYNDASFPTISNSVVQDGCPLASICMDIVTTDPILGALGNYGGFTQTIPLLAGSSAIDVGDDAVCPSTDQRGITRPQGAHCDIGAYEKYAGIYYAKPAASGTGDCQSWVNACTLQTAFRIAVSGNTLWVAKGMYKPTSGADRTTTFQLQNGMVVYGGFAGTETVLDQRNPAANLTILSGDLLGNDNGNIQYDEPTRADNSYHVVTGASGATLDGFTVTGGNANGAYPNSAGGGMLNNSNSPTLMNVTFSGNSASWGGGMDNESSSPLLTNVIFTANSAFYSGGGMVNNDSSNPLLTNVTFSGNSARGGGGGMDNWKSDPILTNVTFSGNSAGSGGGMYNLSSDPKIRNTIFWGNTATTDGAQIYNYTSVPVVSDSVIQGGCPAGSTCTNILTADPNLGALGNYGGFTQTIPLLAGSSAIDTGDDAVCPATDQRGVTRPQGAHCDIGAYEADATAPNTTIDSVPSNPSNDSTPTFTFSGNDGTGSGVASFMCQMDSGGYSACTTPFTSSALLDGSHTFHVYAIDNAGNPDASPASYTWTIDTTPPTVAMISLVSDPTNASPIAVNVTFSESVTGFTFTDIVPTNGAISNFVAVSGTIYTFDLTPAGQGLVTADIAAGVATDSAGNGNTAATQFSRIFTVVYNLFLPLILR